MDFAGKEQRGHGLGLSAILPPAWSERLNETPLPGQGNANEPLLRISIDLPKLRENLSLMWGRRLSAHEVHDFLSRAGFREDPSGSDYWLAADSLLMRLDPSEVISAEPLRLPRSRRRPSRN